MALKLLNPGLRPLGMFDLADADQGNLVGGEYVELVGFTTTGAYEGYAADVGALSAGASLTDNIIQFARNERTAGNLGGLADDGGDEYGTLFGSLIGQNAGRSTQFGTVNGAVVIGPNTEEASGKVTVFAQAGLYGVTDEGTPGELAAAAANAVLSANATTGLLQTTAATSDDVAIYVGEMTDTSLVSTTSTAAGEAATTEYHAVFYTGNAAATDITA
jgi:hypothetical protein